MPKAILVGKSVPLKPKSVGPSHIIQIIVLNHLQQTEHDIQLNESHYSPITGLLRTESSNKTATLRCFVQ